MTLGTPTTPEGGATAPTPGRRIAGSLASWFLFAFCFTVLCLSLFAVLQVGGACADGGPYVIAVHCPENTGLFTLVGPYGAVVAVFVSIFFARTFGTRIILAWTIAFLTISLPFLLVGAASLPGGLSFFIGGLFIVAMALAPVVIEARAAGLQRLVLGLTDARDRRFRERDGARASMFSPGTPNGDDAVTPTPRDWALSLALWLGGSAAGTVLGVLVYLAA